jgi:hypothetical protein
MDAGGPGRDDMVNVQLAPATVHLTKPQPAGASSCAC